MPQHRERPVKATRAALAVQAQAEVGADKLSYCGVLWLTLGRFTSRGHSDGHRLPEQP